MREEEVTPELALLTVVALLAFTALVAYRASTRVREQRDELRGARTARKRAIALAQEKAEQLDGALERLQEVAGERNDLAAQLEQSERARAAAERNAAKSRTTRKPAA